MEKSPKEEVINFSFVQNINNNKNQNVDNKKNLVNPNFTKKEFYEYNTTQLVNLSKLTNEVLFENNIKQYPADFWDIYKSCGAKNKGGFGDKEIIINRDGIKFFLKKINIKLYKILTNEVKFLVFLRNNTISNLLSVKDIYVNKKEKIFYFISKFYENGDLNNYLENTKDKDIFFYCDIVKQLIDCVKALHDLELKSGDCSLFISHGDIKPDNIFVDENGKLVLGDFGLVKFCKRSKCLYGTEGYSCPELSRKQDYNCKKNDIYALGYTLLEICCNKNIDNLINIIFENNEIKVNLDLDKLTLIDILDNNTPFKDNFKLLMKKMICPEDFRHDIKNVIDSEFYNHIKKIEKNS